MQVIPTGEKNRQSLEWNERGQPVGEVSKRFSSTVGVIVRENIPINIISWHEVKIGTKNSAWGLLTVRHVCFVLFELYLILIVLTLKCSKST